MRPPVLYLALLILSGVLLTGCPTSRPMANDLGMVDLSTSPLYAGQDDLYLPEEVDDKPAPAEGYSSLVGKFPYPEEARHKQLEGTVVVAMIVERDGSVSQYHLHRGIGEPCDSAVLDGLKGVPFTPGLLNGEPVRTLFAFHVEYRLPKRYIDPDHLR